ncbi:c-type cytochrome biogenesis protein CcmI [Photobacterium sp. 1_MG-2023]|uniref:c-type cytochrome biogenesis protein CcmI n=1 Tax=Photobacterium sp. 1_MG-2023 TaxID=3062646 RepID=UPI0026E14107|nr:c-type cytochrome biogenesis protein CcmI [Photobacterium sp. 1_MG-2023]MDO6705157.1 c-type cytochrome biogenesis protein CcmI [Photobacterium sp. 1_MG-2023]
MTLFWICTLILVLIALAFFIMPAFVGSNQDQVASRDELNKAFFRDRLGELKEESVEGLVSHPDEMEKELQQSLLDDVPVQKQSQQQRFRPWLLFPGVLVIIGVSYGLYFSVGSAKQVIQWQDTVTRLPELTQRLMGDNAAPLTDQEMDDLTLGLRTRLHERPDDATGWLLLGRIGMANRDLETAQGAMKRALDLSPSDPSLQVSYAQTLMMGGEPGKVQFAHNMLIHLLERDPKNLQAISLLAFEAYGNGDYAQAIDYWEQMKGLLDAKDSRVQMLERSIAQAKVDMHQSANPAPGVSVTVTLGPDVVLPDTGMVVVSAHTADGATMPLAAKRLPLSRFPLNLTLNDSDSMLPDRLMSQQSELIIRARIDQDGNVATKAGDWFGESSIVALGDSATVIINTPYE